MRKAVPAGESEWPSRGEKLFPGRPGLFARTIRVGALGSPGFWQPAPGSRFADLN
jgi:hypothetical protein